MKRLVPFATVVARTLVNLSPARRHRRGARNNRRTPLAKTRATVTTGLCLVVACAAAPVGYAQVIPRQALDANGAPQYRVDPFWPKPLPNRWSMQQIVGISVDSMDHVWYLTGAPLRCRSS